MAQLPEEAADRMLQLKHAAMVERLSNLHQSRLLQKPNNSDLPDFLTRFNRSKFSIQSSLSCISPESKSDNSPSSSATLELENMAISISDLEKLVYENSYFLPSYELRSCLNSISDLRQSLHNVTSQVIPTKKFSFKNKKKKNPPPKDVVIGPKTLSFENQQDLETINGGFKWLSDSSPGFKFKQGEVLVMEFGRKSEIEEFSLTDLTDCEVKLKGCSSSLFVNKLHNCKVYVGPVLGSVLIEDVEGCIFVLASHQIRIHNAKECDFYLRLRSRPIIEDCKGVRFAPYCLRYSGIDEDLGEANLSEETGNWANVDDFRWLRAVQSPNWTVMPENERDDIVDI